MRLFFICTLFSLCIISLFFYRFAYGQDSISISAEHAIVINQDTGDILYEKNAYDEVEIASLTKVLTAIIALEQGDLDEYVSISERAIQATGSSIYLEKSEKITLEDLLYGLMLRSGNDAAIAIAEHVGGSVEGFTFLMNEKVKSLGLSGSHFTNPHGLDEPNHYATAYDLAKMMQYSMENEQFRKIAGTHAYHSASRTYQWNNKNRLLTERYAYCIAGKTGYTSNAGRTLVTSAKKDNQELVAVTFNAPDDWNDHEQLYEWAFAKETEEMIGSQTNKLSFYKRLIHTMSSVMRKIIYG